MKYKRLFLFYLFLLIVLIFTVFSINNIDKKEAIPYTNEENNLIKRTNIFMNVKETLEKNEEMKEGVQVEHTEAKTYIYINIGEKQIDADNKIDFEITNIKEKEEKIEVYAKETGHCTFKYFLKNRLLGVLFNNGIGIPPILYEYKYQIISIEKTDKPIEILWQEPFTCYKK